MRGQLISGRAVELVIGGGRITGIRPSTSTGRWLVPGIIDSHVHLAYLPVAKELRRHGIAAAVDLAAPLDHRSAAPILVLRAGPMLTRPGGYPLDAWGHAGYGLPCPDSVCVRQVITELAAGGVSVIKVALGPDGLAPSLLAAAVTAAHQHGLLVAVHAMGNAEARAAAELGVDVLAHTPLEPLDDATVARWRGRAVISTLAAFGGTPAAVDNLRRLREAGAVILYGTDLGNSQDRGVSLEEIRLLLRAGLDGEAIVHAMTDAPAKLWRMTRLGELRAGAEASWLVLDSDPLRDPAALTRPIEVWHRGERVGP